MNKHEELINRLKSHLERQKTIAQSIYMDTGLKRSEREFARGADEQIRMTLNFIAVVEAMIRVKE